MTTSYVNDVQSITPNNAGHIQQPKGDVVTHQPLPSYAQVHVPVIQNSPATAYIYQNGQLIPVVHINTGRNGPYSFPENTSDIPDFTAWSIFNILCCVFLFGIVALLMSIRTKNRKIMGDIKGARSASNCTAIVNTLATLSGIGIYVLLVLYYTGHIKY
jgi:hypothetical protein